MYPLNVVSATADDVVVVADNITATDPSGLSASTGMNFTILPAITGVLGFPRIGQPRIGNRDYTLDDANGENNRDFMARADIAFIGLYADGPWDTGAGGQLSRDAIYDDLHARNPNLVVMDYQAVMEGGISGNKGTKGQAETGPVGNGGTWLPNDWIGRDIDGTPLGSFGSAVNFNLTDYVTPDVDGNRFPRYIAGYNDDKHMIAALPVVPGANGCNLFFDVYDRRPLLNNVDWNRDGSRSQARNNYDPENPAHDPLGVAQAAAWRQGYRDVIDFFHIKYPLVITTGNLTTWSREYSGVDMSEAAMPSLALEHIDSMHGGWVEGQSLKRTTFTFSGVASDGLNMGNGFGNWRMAYSSYVYCMYKSTRLDSDGAMPKYVMNQWEVDIIPQGSNNPGAGTAFNLARWAIVSTLLDDGYVGISDVSPLQYGSSVHFDEFGTVNTLVTGLSKGWLGQPIDAPQRVLWTGNLWKREYANGIVIINTDNDETNAAATVPVTSGTDPIGAGIYKRITGSQDSAFNNGQIVNANFSLEPIDAIILERI